MFVKCFIVEMNSGLESMYDQLRESGFDWSEKKIDDNYFEITFEEWEQRRIQEAMEIMKWYV